MSESVGDAADFARLLAGQGRPQPSEDTAPDTEQRRAIAQRHGLAPDLGDRLRGDTLAELEADAAAVAALTQRAEPTEPPTTGNDRARRNLREQLGIGTDQAKVARDAALVQLLHPSGQGDGDTEGGTPIALDPIKPGPAGPPSDRGDALQAGDEPFPSDG